MKPIEIHRDIRTLGVTLAQDMGIAEGQEHVIQNVLRKKLYSDKAKSIFREYLSNALDEHVRLNKADVPFVVHFPNQLEPTLRIRDFGRGLTDEQVLYFFGKFGASDKRDTNELIGQFGLGNKVAHCYTDSYTVVSYLNGKQSIFNCYIGEGNLSKIAKFGDSIDTTEPNGVEIQIAVEPKDISLFVQKGLEVAKYFPVAPKIEGLSYQPDLSKRPLVASGTGWRYYGSSFSSKAVCLMGCIAYDINSYAMGDLSSAEQQLLNSNLELDIAIGDVEVTASREDLEMSELTIKAIKARLKIVLDEMVAEAEKSFANVKTEFEARKLYHEKVQGNDGYANILRQHSAGLKWNGIAITNNLIKLKDVGQIDSNHNIITYHQYYRRRKYRVEQLSKTSTLTCTKEMEDSLYFDDTTDGKAINYTRRAETLLRGNTSQVLLLQTKDVADFEKRTGLKVKSLKSYAAVTPYFVSTARGGNGPDKAKRKKHQTKVFELDLAELHNGNSIASDNWKLAEIDLDAATGVYFEIDRFKPTSRIIHDLRHLSRLLTMLETVGIKVNIPIYGFKKGVTNFGKLQNFETWAKEQIEAIPNFKEDYGLAQEHESYMFEIAAPESKLSGTALKYKKLVKRLTKARQHFSTKQNLVNMFGIDAPETKLIETLKNELFKEFPLLRFMKSQYHNTPEVLEYITPKPKAAKAASV